MDFCIASRAVFSRQVYSGSIALAVPGHVAHLIEN
jgi:hypothetical protein